MSQRSSQVALEHSFHEGKSDLSFKKGPGTGVKVAIAVSVLAAVTVTVVLAVCLTGNCGSSSSDNPCNLDCGADQIAWGYEESNGASCWASCYDKCGAESQSPLNLDTGITEDIAVASPLQIDGYDRSQAFSMLNNGHTVSVNIEETGNQIQGLDLPAVYEAYQFHFHWGETSARGSEHTVNGREYPMEVHIVHYNTNFNSPGEAAGEPEGLAVLGFFFTVTPDDNPAYDFITSKLGEIPHKDSPGVDLDPQVLLDLIPVDLDHFFRYSGSLTTPPCSETVVWTVFTTPIPISERQLDAFRSLYAGKAADSPNTPLVDTYRPPQPRNDRDMYFGNNA